MLQLLQIDIDYNLTSGRTSRLLSTNNYTRASFTTKVSSLAHAQSLSLSLSDTHTPTEPQTEAARMCTYRQTLQTGDRERDRKNVRHAHAYTVTHTNTHTNANKQTNKQKHTHTHTVPHPASVQLNLERFWFRGRRVLDLQPVLGVHHRLLQQLEQAVERQHLDTHTHTHNVRHCIIPHVLSAGSYLVARACQYSYCPSWSRVNYSQSNEWRQTRRLSFQNVNKNNCIYYAVNSNKNIACVCQYASSISKCNLE